MFKRTLQKHEKIFCKQNPTMDIKCENCKTKNTIKLQDVMESSYKYSHECKKCKEITEYDMKSLKKELEIFKKLC